MIGGVGRGEEQKKLCNIIMEIGDRWWVMANGAEGV